MATAGLFLAALFFSPLVSMVGGGVERGGLFYYPVTAPAVIVVGSFMMRQVARIRWDDATEALPAFAAMVAIPFTFNIAHGVAAGIVAHVAVKAGAGRAREVSRVAWVLAVLVLAAYALLPRLRH